jgi:hypothetical protein
MVCLSAVCLTTHAAFQPPLVDDDAGRKKSDIAGRPEMALTTFRRLAPRRYRFTVADIRFYIKQAFVDITELVVCRDCGCNLRSYFAWVDHGGGSCD